VSLSLQVVAAAVGPTPELLCVLKQGQWLLLSPRMLGEAYALLVDSITCATYIVHAMLCTLQVNAIHR
jgi:hypothetical protein